MKDAPSAYDVTHGMPPGLFADLPSRKQKWLVRLLARVAERSYRRGFQQGVHIQKNRPQTLPSPLDIANWRYGNSTDKSPWPDRPGYVEPSVRRFWMENDHVRKLGIWEGRAGQDVPDIGEEQVAEIRRQAFLEAAQICETYAEVNFEAAGDLTILNPILRGEDWTAENVEKSEDMMIKSSINCAQHHAGRHLAAALRERSGQ